MCVELWNWKVSLVICNWNLAYFLIRSLHHTSISWIFVNQKQIRYYCKPKRKVFVWYVEYKFETKNDYNSVYKAYDNIDIKDCHMCSSAGSHHEHVDFSIKIRLLLWKQRGIYEYLCSVRVSGQCHMFTSHSYYCSKILETFERGGERSAGMRKMFV